ncbi:LOW QUALITY PROTEIN: hypothetical protein CRUP_037450, partial [Coryphaenoides rupestris]
SAALLSPGAAGLQVDPQPQTHGGGAAEESCCCPWETRAHVAPWREEELRVDTAFYWIYWELPSTATVCYWIYWELPSTATVCYWFYWELPSKTTPSPGPGPSRAPGPVLAPVRVLAQPSPGPPSRAPVLPEPPVLSSPQSPRPGPVLSSPRTPVLSPVPVLAMPVRRRDAQRALVLLEEYRTKLNQTDDRQLKHSIQRVIDIFQSSLFQALIDIQEFYEVTLLDSQKCVDPARSWEPLPPVNLWDLSSLQSPTGTSETLPSISTSIESPTGTSETLPSISTSIEESALLQEIFQALAQGRAASPRPKYRHHDEDASPQDACSPQPADEAPGPELVQVAERSLSQVASLESIFEGSSLLEGHQELSSLPPSSPRPLGSPLPSTSSNPYPPESPLPFCSSNPYPSQLLIQAEGAMPSSPIIPVIPVSPIPAEGATRPPASPPSQANPPPVVVNTDSLDTPPYVST